jgi:hypothetical protein
VKSLIKSHNIDSPKISYFIFQIPSFLIYKLGFTDISYYALRLKTIGFLLSFYPVVSFIVMYKILKNDFINHFYILSTAVCIYSILIFGPAFSGAHQSFTFFIILYSVQVKMMDDKDFNSTRGYVTLLLVASFFYLPTTFMGTFFLILHWIASKFKRTKAFYTLVILNIVSAFYLVFLNALPFDKTYDESLNSIAHTLFSDRFNFYLASIAFTLSYFLKTKPRRFVQCVSSTVGVIWYCASLYVNWQFEILNDQHYYRIYSYTLGFLFVGVLAFKKRVEFGLISRLFVLVVVILCYIADLRATYVFKKNLVNVLNLSNKNRTCVSVDYNKDKDQFNLEDLNSITFLTTLESSQVTMFAKNADYVNEEVFFKSYCAGSFPFKSRE